MLDRLKSLFRTSPKRLVAREADVGSLNPERTLFIVGDVHGSYELLQRTVTGIDAFLEERGHDPASMPQLIFVGDYIDRGENSADVLHWLFNLTCEVPDNVASEHLRLMQRCGFFTNQREGRKVYYEVAEPHLENIMACVESRFLS